MDEMNPSRHENYSFEYSLKIMQKLLNCLKLPLNYFQMQNFYIINALTNNELEI